jgi:outer membrane biosynthesis protein TonB
MAAHAQSGLDAQCPNAVAMLDSIAFPLDLPAATKTDEAVVEFTIGADGSIGEATAACANFPAVLQGLDVPRNLVRSGVRRGDLVLEFMLQPSGRATDFVVLRTSSREFAAEAIRALEDLRCMPSAQPRRVRVPLSFRVDCP